MKEWGVGVLQLTRPWLKSGVLERGLERWRYCARLYGVFERSGVNVASSEEELHKDIIYIVTI